MFDLDYVFDKGIKYVGNDLEKCLLNGLDIWGTA